MIDLPCARTALCRYRYDALDRLAGVDNGAQELVWRFYQKSRLSVEMQGTLQRSVFQFDDRLLAVQCIYGATCRVDLLGTDGQRSVLHRQGLQDLQSTAYSAYGHQSQENALLGFNGERLDPVSGHYLLGNGYRAFNPVLMRFNQPDNMSPFGQGGLNAYAYCQGDPVNRSDATGHISGFRAPGLSMFASKFPLEALPDVAFAKVLEFLPGDDLVSLSGTSYRMNQRVVELSIIPAIDIQDIGALPRIKMDLKGRGSGVLPANLKSSEGYKKQFKRAAATSAARLDTQAGHLGSLRQSIIDRVMGTGQSHGQFIHHIALNRRAHSASPGALADIHRVTELYDELWLSQHRLALRRLRLSSLARQIRKNLN